MGQKIQKVDEKCDLELLGGSQGATRTEVFMRDDAPVTKDIILNEKVKSDEGGIEQKGGPLLTLKPQTFGISKCQKKRGNRSKIVNDPNQPKLWKFWGSKSENEPDDFHAMKISPKNGPN